MIDHPQRLWVAPALVSEMWEVEEVLRDAGIGVECFVRGGQLYSFRQPVESEWEQLCDIAGAEQFGASEWAESDDPVRQHEFAELLRRALGEKVRDMMDYDRREKLFYFRAPDDLSDVRLPVAGACSPPTVSEMAGSASAAISDSAFSSTASTATGTWN